MIKAYKWVTQRSLIAALQCGQKFFSVIIYTCLLWFTMARITSSNCWVAVSRYCRYSFLRMRFSSSFSNFIRLKMEDTGWRTWCDCNWAMSERHSDCCRISFVFFFWLLILFPTRERPSIAALQLYKGWMVKLNHPPFMKCSYSTESPFSAFSHSVLKSAVSGALI